MKTNNEPISILLVEDNEIDIRNLQYGFKENKISVDFSIAKTGQEALDKLYGQNGASQLLPSPQLILLDIDMPKMNGMEFLEKLRADPHFQSLTVFIVTSLGHDIEKSLLKRLNVSGYFDKPLDFEKFLPVFKKNTAKFFEEKLTLLLVDDSKLDRLNIIHMLNQSSPDVFRVVEVECARDALAVIKREKIDCVLLDYKLPDIDGLALLHKIKQTTNHAGVPIIVITGVGNEDIAVDAMKQGATDYVVKYKITPVLLSKKINDGIQLLKNKQEVDHQRTQTEHDAHYDSLITGLMNRRGFEEAAFRALADTKRHSRLLALLFMDLDGFKNINDSFGHAVGDALLIEVGKRLLSNLRSEDLVARMGGDEFAIFLIGLAQNTDGEIVAEKILKEMAKPFKIQKEIIHFGISIGIAYSQGHDILSKLIDQADEALLDVKASGRGSYKVFSPYKR